jgi:hypothetical protein
MTYTVSVNLLTCSDEDANAAMEHFQKPFADREIALRDARMVSDLFPGMEIGVVEKPHADSAKGAKWIAKFVDGVSQSFLEEIK